MCFKNVTDFFCFLIAEIKRKMFCFADNFSKINKFARDNAHFSYVILHATETCQRNSDLTLRFVKGREIEN